MAPPKAPQPPVRATAWTRWSGYSYDPWGRRIWKEIPGTQNTAITGEIYFYGVTGQKLETYSFSYGNSFSSSLEGINVYFGKKLLQSKGNWVVTDKLGSVRANSSLGAMSYFPYGEERTSTANGVEKFGTYTQDGVGHAEQRYYNASYGAFWSPDPGGIMTARASNPASWNRYMYVNGDPVNFIDRDGRFGCDPNKCAGEDPPKLCSEGSDDPLCTNRGGRGTAPNPPAQQGGGGGGTSFANAKDLFQRLAKSLAKNKFSKAPCQADLADVGTDTAAVQADAADIDIENGAGSSALESSLYANTAAYSSAQAQFGSETIGQYMSQNAGTVAEAQLVGNTVYLNPALINPGNYFQNIGTLLHEILHNVTGMDDSAIQSALGLPTNQVSNNITQKLIKDCF